MRGMELDECVCIGMVARQQHRFLRMGSNGAMCRAAHGDTRVRGEVRSHHVVFHLGREVYHRECVPQPFEYGVPKHAPEEVHSVHLEWLSPSSPGWTAAQDGQELQLGQLR